VGLLLNHDNDVSRLNTRVLISFAVELILLVVRCSLVNLGFKDFLLLDYLFAIASFALIFFINDFALSTAIVARTSRLTVHARTELNHLIDHTTTTAGSTLLHGSVLAAFTLAGTANALAVDSNFGSLASVDLLKSDLKGVHNRLALLGSLLLAASSSTKHLGKEIVHATTATTTFLEAFFSVFVVDITLLLVNKNFVGILKILELVLVTSAIGMVLEGEFAESFFDFVKSCFLVYSESFVVLGGVYILGWAATHSAHFLKVTEGEASAKSATEHF
jgi:hypothetical protein